MPTLPELSAGWTARYTTDLTPTPWFYLRGEEYSAQVDHFIRCIEDRGKENFSTFASALATDKLVAMLLRDAERGEEVPSASATSERKRFLGLFG